MSLLHRAARPAAKHRAATLPLSRGLKAVQRPELTEASLASQPERVRLPERDRRPAPSAHPPHPRPLVYPAQQAHLPLEQPPATPRLPAYRSDDPSAA